MNNNTLHHSNPLRFLLRCTVILAFLLPATLWGQVTLTTDTNGNGTIEDSEKVLYLIQTNQFQSFYMIPKDNNVSTANIPNADMLWYFLDAGEVSGTQYYYIINNSTGKCIYNYNGNSRGIQLTVLNSLSDADKEKCKFKLVEDNSNGTVGFYNIDVKASQSYYGLNKQGGSVNVANPIRLTNNDYIHDYSSKWKFILYTGTFTWPDPPFTPSTNSQNYYYKIHNKTNGSYYVSSDASSPKKVTISSTESDNMVWYFIEASTDSWIKYYYIVNPEAGEYMYYKGTATDGSNQSNAIILKEKTSENEDRFQFIIVQTARMAGNDRVEAYTIIPKLLKDKYWASNCICPTSITEGNPLGIRNGRGSDTNNAHWDIVPTTYVVSLDPPTITVNCDNSISLTCEGAANASIRYTTDGTTTPTNTVGTLFDPEHPFTPADGATIMAVAYIEDLISDVLTTTYHPEYSVAPTITFTSATNVAISYATTATIYYNLTEDGSDPGTPTTSVYTGTGTANTTLNVTIDPTKVIRISAIAKAGSLNASCNVATGWQLPQPTFSQNCDNELLIATSIVGAHIYYTTSGPAGTPATPTASSTEYSGPIQGLSDGDKLKAIVIKDDNNSFVADYTYHPTYSTAPTITFTAADNVAISYATTATIYYNLTEDGSEPAMPTTSSYTGTGTANTTLNVSIDPTKEIRISAIAKTATQEASCASATGWKLAQPELSTSCDDNTLTITSANNVYYTTGAGGGTPTTGSTQYTEPISGLSVGDRLNILAIDGGGHTSYLIQYTHAITHTAPPVITATPVPGSISITITGSGDLYYTTNGVDPVIGEPNVHSYPDDPIVYDGTTMDIRAIAKDGSLGVSCVTQLVTIGTPTVTIVADDCSEASPRGNVVNIPIPEGCTIWYAVTAGEDSEAPDPNSYAYVQYTAPIAIDDQDGSETVYRVHAYAKQDDIFSSIASSDNHVMKTGGKPVLTPPVGSSPVVGISGGVFGDVAICSATGVATQNIPLASDGTAEYAIPAEATGTLSIAFKHGEWLTSCEATYTIPQAPAAPTWSQSCDNKLSLSTESPMAVIHYTLDDTPVLATSATYTEGCLYDIEVGTIVRAKAFEGFLSSDELRYEYQHTHALAPRFFVDGTRVSISSATPEATIYFTFNTNNNENEDDPIDDPENPNSSTAISFNLTPPYTANPNTTYILGNQDFILSGITKFKAIAVKDGLEESCVVSVTTREGYSITNVTQLNSIASDPEKRGKYWFIENDFDASSYTGPVNFTGVLVGNYHTISGLTTPLFNETSGNAVVRGLNLKDVNIPSNTSGNVGALVCTALDNTRVYNCGILPTTADGSTTSHVGGTGSVGGLVGELQGSARVINCFSYADIISGDYRGGIVGRNNVTTASTQSSVNTMVMNCMFYGNIEAGGSYRAPIYGGKKISNSGSTGLNNYNYFRFNQPYVENKLINVYNCALGAQDRYLQRFEFFRYILNSNYELASLYIKGTVTGASDRVGHWVLDKSVAPYPILKSGEGTYASIINPDAAHAIPIDPDNVHRNEGRKLGELTVKIAAASGWANKPDGAGLKDNSYATSGLIINMIDKDVANYNFNYKKIQLPYYNEVGTNNYTDYKVVTGWKITGIVGGTAGSFTTGVDAPAYNFVDRACTNKDLYSVSGRVFNQGAYWEVPDNVSEITIEPYWANCVYLSDAGYDVTYGGDNDYSVSLMGVNRPTTFNDEQTVYNDFYDAHSNLNSNSSATVYDYAIVLVGNYHKRFGSGTSEVIVNENKPFTVMSADFDDDNEPDNSFFYQHTARIKISPIRFDFINIPDIGLAQKEDGAQSNFQVGIFRPYGWFEITNTVLIHFEQFEYSDKTNKTIVAPLILQGGIYEQFVSARNADADKINYLIIGGNAWFKNFANGCHTGASLNTPKVPISVAGGDYENFYLSGIYRPEWAGNTDNAECYIDGGRFGEVAGAGRQFIGKNGVGGNVTWIINAADIEHFYGGGINDAKPIQGNISTTISNSWVTEFCGGPKFGTMKPNKTVTTIAYNCHFGDYFGAGYGGTAINRQGVEDQTYQGVNKPESEWNNWVTVTHYTRGYETTHHSNVGSGSDVEVKAISTGYEYEYFFFSGGANKNKVARFYINYATLSLATTNDVTSTLTGCSLNNFYGGGKFGYVSGNATSTLNDCTITGNAFGSGFSAAVPTCDVLPLQGFVTAPSYDNNAGVFNDEQVADGGYPTAVTYTWKHAESVSTGHEFDETDGHFILTTVNLDNLGTVSGNATLTINGNTKVEGDVYGGGALASSNIGGTGTTQVNINGGTYGVNDGGVITGGNIYGGGMGNAQNAVTEGNIQVNIGNESQSANSVVINGNVYGCNNANGSPQGNVTVDVWVTKHNSDNTVSNENGGYAIANVFGGGNLANFTAADKTATVRIHGCENTIGRVFGGGDAAAAPGVVTVIDGGRYDWVFGGGNGEVTAANIGDGGANLTVHGGKIHHLFGGSNERGTISGSMLVDIDNSSGCDEYIDEFFGGCNLVELGTAEDPVDLNTTIGCGTIFGSVYGGSNKANINGDVTLTIEGGTIDYVYGGSKGVAVGDETYSEGLSADISGDVTLNLVGGTIGNAFGGSNILGSIDGQITVNVEDAEDPNCQLVLTNVFGGGNLAVYTGSPEVNVKHGTVLGNVYGGGNGDPADGTQTKGSTGAPTVIIGDLTNVDYQAIVEGDVYGGGNAAKVTGATTTVQVLNKCNTEIQGAVYGGGNMALVPATSVSIAGGTIGDVFGGGHGDNDPEHSVAANVTGNTSVSVTGATIDRVFAGANLNGNIGGTMALSIDKSDEANCGMIIREVYGGGNMAAGKAANITIGCTGDIVAGEDGHVAHPENIGTSLEGIGTLYGGANQANIGTSENQSDITLNINSGIINKVFGGNNTSGEIYGDITVNIEKTSDACGWYVGDVFGGGDHAYYEGTPDVNIIAGTVYRNVYGGGNDITTANKGVNGSDVEMTGGTVLGGIYGGCNTRGVVVNNAQVSITSGTIGSETALAAGTVSNVFGGGLGANTQVKGNVTVTIDSTASIDAPEIWGDVYGGSEFGSVNTISNGNTTTVNIYNGHFKQKAINGTSPITSQDTTYYYGGNIYGGGLGDVGDVNKGQVNGVITVNVGQINPSSGGKGDQDDIDYIGEATIEGNVYGCNNTNGSPQDSVVVNIFHTAHVLADTVGNNEPDAPYAIANVFGGGNLADYTASTKKARVNIFGCDNTIRRVFGGGNAAAAPTVVTDIKGGRFYEVFGGGNGEVSPANVNGNVVLGIHGGNVKEFYGGSNQQGNITGTTVINVDDTGCDYVNIDEFFCGGKFANYSGNIDATITCSEGMNVKNLYGGCKQAHVVPNGNDPNAPGYEPGNIHLVVKGGTYENIYGGSQGTPSEPANIAGSVTLEVLGGTVTHAIFGGSNINGNIGGTITVRVEQGTGEDVCPLDAKLADVYGGGNQADYSAPATDNHNYPDVTIKNAMVKNVFGGGLEAEVTGNPQIKIKKGSRILGNVYGGGNMGQVDGNPRVIINGKME